MYKSRIGFIIATLICGTFLFSCTLQADPNKNKGKSNKDEFNVEFGLSGTVTAGITIGDARKLASHYGVRGGKPIPPGIRKNLARGKPMPPGIQKTRMPGSFVNELPHHEGYEWRRAGTDLVLVVTGSLVISDILEGVFD